MPYVAPSTVVAGQTYSAASHNIIVNDIIDHEDRLDTVQNAQYPYRNVLINGAMQIAQRGTSVSGITAFTASPYYTADRWNVSVSANGTFTNAITADTPTGQGFANAFRMTATVSAATAAPSYVIVQQRLEGQTLQHIKKGTANAQQLTLQFWVKGNRTGTYIAELFDNNNTRRVSSAYTINASDTWEQKTMTFPADTTGVLTNDANGSLYLNFWLSAGTDSASGGTLNTTWGNPVTNTRAVGQTNVAGATNGYWQVTGVQLEPGSQASPYEFVLYQDELRRCQRYYVRFTGDTSGYWRFAAGQSYSGTQATFVLHFPVPLRTTASSMDTTGTASNYACSTTSAGVAACTSVPTCPITSRYSAQVEAVCGAGTFNIGGATVLFANNNNTAYLGFSAEL